MPELSRFNERYSFIASRSLIYSLIVRDGYSTVRNNFRKFAPLPRRQCHSPALLASKVRRRSTRDFLRRRGVGRLPVFEIQFLIKRKPRETIPSSFRRSPILKSLLNLLVLGHKVSGCNKLRSWKWRAAVCEARLCNKNGDAVPSSRAHFRIGRNFVERYFAVLANSGEAARHRDIGIDFDEKHSGSRGASASDVTRDTRVPEIVLARIVYYREINKPITSRLFGSSETRGIRGGTRDTG